MLNTVARDLMGERACERMLREIEQDVRYTRHHLGLEALSTPVLQALRDVPRHAFVPDALQDAAYDNRPLPIGENQTISQPYIVAVMTELLALTPEHQVLEVGTGSGYQTAVLARLAKRVYSIEIVETLAKRAASRLKHLGFHNVEMRIGDGYNGWPEVAPFDAIIITAAADRVPPPLLEQLKPGGRLIVPLNHDFDQELVLLSKAPSGEISQRKILPVAFVPMTGLARDISGKSSS